eukprot:3282308-Pleurochrysis_carterae.AAC.1
MGTYFNAVTRRYFKTYADACKITKLRALHCFLGPLPQAFARDQGLSIRAAAAQIGAIFTKCAPRARSHTHAPHHTTPHYPQARARGGALAHTPTERINEGGQARECEKGRFLQVICQKGLLALAVLIL